VSGRPQTTHTHSTRDAAAMSSLSPGLSTCRLIPACCARHPRACHPSGHHGEGRATLKSLCVAQRTARRTCDLAVSHTTASNLPFARNWYRHLQGAGVRNFALLATDSEAYQALAVEIRPHAVHCPTTVFAARGSHHGPSGYRSHEWSRLMFAVPRMVQWVLSLGVDAILWMDTDVVALANPFPRLRANLDAAGENTAILASVDGRVPATNLLECERSYSNDPQWGHSAGGWKLCGGLFYIRHSVAANAFLREWDRRLRAPGAGAKNQPHYNSALRETGIGFRLMPCPTFPNGFRYASSAWRQAQSETPLLVHNNWIKGHAAKLERFRLWGLWFEPASGGENTTSTRHTQSQTPAPRN